MDDAKKLKLLENTTRIITRGSVKQVEMFSFYIELGITALNEMAQKDEAIKKAKMLKQVEDKQKAKAKSKKLVVKKPIGKKVQNPIIAKETKKSEKKSSVGKTDPKVN